MSGSQCTLCGDRHPCDQAVVVDTERYHDGETGLVGPFFSRAAAQSWIEARGHAGLHYTPRTIATPDCRHCNRTCRQAITSEDVPADASVRHTMWMLPGGA